jgi:MFS family permease
MREGARVIWQDPILRALTATTFAFELVGNGIGVVIMLFFVRDLHLQPLALGPVFGLGGMSALLGAVLTGRVVQRWGLGRALIGSLYVDTAGLLAVVVAGGPVPLVLALMSVGQATDAGRTVYEINAVSLLQSRAPERYAGRVFATYETLKSAAMLLGLAVGGVLGGIIGLRDVLALAFIADLLVPLFLVFSPLRTVHAINHEVSLECLAMQTS